jgi:hypothetical protein
MRNTGVPGEVSLARGWCAVFGVFECESRRESNRVQPEAEQNKKGIPAAAAAAASPGVPLVKIL